MSIKSKLVGLRRPHPPLGSCQVVISENEHGYNGMALSVTFGGESKGFIFQDAKFAEPGYVNVINILDALGEDAVIGRQFDAELTDIIDGPTGRKIGLLEIEIPEITTKEKKGRTVMSTTKKVTAAATTTEVETYTLFAAAPKNGGGTVNKEARYAPAIVNVGRPESPRLPVELRLNGDSIAVVVKDIVSKNGTEIPEAVIAYISETAPCTTKKLNEERTGAGLAAVADEILNPSDLRKYLEKGRVSAYLAGSHKLINLVVQAEVAPDQSRKQTMKKLTDLGVTQERVHATNTYLSACGWNADMVSTFWRDFLRVHKKHKVYLPEKLDFPFVDNQGAMWKLHRSYMKSVGSIIVGPPATGKDIAIDTYCRLMGIRAVHQVADGNMDADILIGMTGITNDNGVGITQFQPSALMECLNQQNDEYITLFILDEANMANPDQFVVLNELLNIEWPTEVILGEKDETKVISFTRGGDREVSPEFRMMMTMNVDLEGCKTFNQATWTRLDTIIFQQSVSMKEVLLKEFPSLGNKNAVMADRLWSAIKNESKNSGEDEVTEVGPRNFKSAARDVVLFDTPMKEALEQWVLSKISMAEIREAMEKMLISF